MNPLLWILFKCVLRSTETLQAEWGEKRGKKIKAKTAREGRNKMNKQRESSDTLT